MYATFNLKITILKQNKNKFNSQNLFNVFLRIVN